MWVHENFPENAPDILYYPNAIVGDILLNINPNMEKSELQFASWICVLEDGLLVFKGMERIF